ncbi:MAG: hypothetical protein JW854_03485 [Actinobacteria bacterium]|nr:hypothetical protein [Actinomycetota bacterium]
MLLAMIVPLQASAPAAPAACPDFYWQNPLPQGNALNDIAAIDTLTAMTVGDHGTILKTTDGGASWVSLPSGTDLDLAAVSAANQSVIYVTGDEGIILKTVDGGASWSQHYEPDANMIYGVDAVNANVAWIASEGNAAVGGVVMRTTNGGTTWEDKTPGTFPILSDIDALSADFAWLCGPGAISKTTDGGTNWDMETLPVETYFTAIQVFDTNKAMVVGYAGTVLRTENGGTNWNQVDIDRSLQLNDLSFTNDETGWVVGEQGLVARTGDGGANWDYQHSKAQEPLLGICASSTDQAWVSGQFGVLLRTYDGGTNWNRLSMGDTDVLFDICVAGNRTLWAVGADANILKTNDGGNRWFSQVSPSSVDYYGVGAGSARTAWAVGEGGTIINTTDGGASWTTQSSGVSTTLWSVAAVDSATAWAAGPGALLRTGDGGTSWQKVDAGYAGEMKVEAVDANTAWIYGHDGYVARTDDAGKTWHRQEMSMGALFSVENITAMSAADGNNAYATVIVVEKGKLGDFSVIFKTNDGGSHWENTFATGTGTLDLFAVAASDDDTAWACGIFGQVLKTVDGGGTWNQQDSMTDTVLNAAVAVDDNTAWIAGWGGNILRTTSPIIYAVSPDQGMNTSASTSLELRGTGFQVGMAVELERTGEGNITASSVNVVSPEKAACEFDLRGAAEGVWDVTATNSNGLSHTHIESFHVISATHWYLAEGSTGSDAQGGFETWVLLQNPNGQPAMAMITYLTASGEMEGPTVPLDPKSRATINVAGNVPGEWSVSAVVDSDLPIIVERSVYWNVQDGAYRQACGESIGSPFLSRNWFLAEGSTGSDDQGSFETWVLLGNPGGDTAAVDLTYMTPQGSIPGPSLDVPPGVRLSVNAAENVPDEWHVSTLVESNRPIVAERAMYWNTPATRRLSAHTSIGAAHPALEWYLAEGSTGSDEQGFFETWVLVENPNDYAASVDIVYQTPDGQVPGPSFELLPHTRASWDTSLFVPAQFSVSTVVRANNPVVSERSMYWTSAGQPRVSATDSIGVTSASRTWNLAEGSTGGDERGWFETWVLVQNPFTTAADVHITYMTPAGPVAGPDFNLPAQSRISLPVSATVPNEWSVSTVVESNHPVVAERSMYWNTGTYRQAASDSIGFP